jgi:hypothetical protein
MSENTLIEIRPDLPPKYDQDPEAGFEGFVYLGRMSVKYAADNGLTTSEDTDAYIHMSRPTAGEPKVFGFAHRFGNEDSEYGYFELGVIISYEDVLTALCTGENNSRLPKYREMAKAAINQGVIKLDSLLQNLQPIPIQEGYISKFKFPPEVFERVASAQAFDSVEEWEQAWLDAYDIARELAELKPYQGYWPSTSVRRSIRDGSKRVRRRRG